MYKFIVILIFFSVFTFCGPSEEEIFLQDECNKKLDEVNRIIDYWNDFNQEIFSEEFFWEGYRDDMFFVQQELLRIIESCEDMFLAYNLENKREQIIRDIGYIEGYWQAKSES